MTTLATLLRDLREAEVEIWLDGENLRFRAPRGALTELLRGELQRHRLDVIELLRRSPEEELEPPLRVEHRGPSLLSYAQERLWFLDRLAEGRGITYNVPSAWHIAGDLRPERLEQAFRQVIQRHEILRTVLPEVDGAPSPRVLDDAPFSLTVVDLRGLAAEFRDTEVQRQIHTEACRPLSVAEGPLWGARLLRLDEDQHVLALVIHHIVCDGWGLGVLLRELGHAYRLPGALAEPSLQYADFAVWQRRTSAQPALQRQIRYWERQFAELPPPLDLPSDRPRPAALTVHGASRWFILPRALESAVLRLSRAEGLTTFMTLLAGFIALLHRLTDQTDVVVGAPIANRRHADLEAVVGLFVNMIALRVHVSSKMTFVELLRQVRNVCLDAYANQDLPFEMLVERLQPHRDLSRTPIYQVVFDYHSGPRAELSLPGATSRALRVHTGTAKYDLLLEMAHDEHEGLVGMWEYCTDLFDAATIERFERSFTTLLEHAAVRPATPLGELPLMDEATMRQVLAWSETEPGRRERGCIHELFERQVARVSDRVAVVAADGHVSYGQLNRRANQLAWRLRRMAVGPETLVGVAIRRSSMLVASLFGVLKAGGAYVPLDPAYPPERLRFMLTDSRARVLLTERALLPKLPRGEAKVLVLDDESPDLLSERGDDLPPVANPDHLAYVIYTSGSTGTPKAVAIAHSSALTRLEWAHDAYPDWALAGVLASTSICFDLSVFELFAPLCHGGTAILAEGALQLPQLEAAPQVRLINTVPTAIAELVRNDALPKSVRIVNLAGEPLSETLVREVYSTGSVERVHDLYGPTEDTTYSTWTLRHSGDPPTIGRPLPSTRACVLDSCLSPVPPGIPGELFLGGSGQARGYLGRPALTAQRFVPDPLAAIPGARLYRTGDRVRYRDNGELEYGGRLDDQVKLRGFRVELGEVETVLAQHPAVAEAGAAVLEERPNDRRLVAFLVPRDGGVPATVELNAFLKERVPDHLIPSAYRIVPQLPRTASGKLDRRTLLSSAEPIAPVHTPYVPPQSPVEELLAQIWANALDVPRVGVRDDFFELGGHSLLAARVNARARAAFGVDLQLCELFQAPTVAQQAQVILGLQQERRPLLPLVPVVREEPVPLTSAQEQLWHIQRIIPDAPLFNMPHGISLTGLLDVSALERSVDDLVRRHEILRTLFHETPSGPRQRIVPASPSPLRIVDLSHLSDKDRERAAADVALHEFSQPFRLAKEPAFRALLLRCGPLDHRLVLTLHHIISDGWSQRVLAHDLVVLYRAHARGASSALPPLPLQFADFAWWERQWLRSGALAQALAYWKAQIGPSPAPLLWHKPATPSTPYLVRSGPVVTLPDVLEARLRTFSRKSGVTVFLTLLAILYVVVRRLTGADEIRIGTMTANRDNEKVEGLIGLFANTLVLPACFTPTQTFADFLQQVREVFVTGLAHQALPFEVLGQTYTDELHVARANLFQTMFLYEAEEALAAQNQPLSWGRWPIVEDLRRTKLGACDVVVSAIDAPARIQLSFLRGAAMNESVLQELAVAYEDLLPILLDHPDRVLS